MTITDSASPRRMRVCCFAVLRSLKITCIVFGGIFLVAIALVADVALFQRSKYDESVRGTTIVTKSQHSMKSSSTGVGFQYPMKEEPEGLKLAWLMSFPNSGTSYTAQLVREATKTVSATNYADETLEGELGFRDPVFQDEPDGPFWINPEENKEFTRPIEYVITKTHCGIRCTMCPPEKYSETTYSFRSKCFITKWVNFNETTGNMDRVFSAYEPDRLTKAIHLFRNPFDNIVSRYHLEQLIPDRLAAQYPKSREGFREYCKETDNLYMSNEKRMLFLSEALMQLMKNVPCHSDFFRYIEWHNLAFVTTRDLHLNTYVLHYDSYRDNFKATVKSLLNFLEMPMHKQGELTPFIQGKEYHYFTNEERQAVAKAFETMASPDTWSNVKQYFENIEQNEGDEEIKNIQDTDSRSVTGSELWSRPPLSSLVNEGSLTDIIGDVQFLLDFAIIGYPKTATTTTLIWLANQTEIQMYEHEVYHLKDGEPAEMVRQLYALPEGDHYKRGYKAPRDIHNVRALDAFAKYFPKTKFIIGLRHPVLWFESFYNYRTRNNFTLPETDQLIGSCIAAAANVCTEEIRYMDHLSKLGKTDRSSHEELALLTTTNPKDLQGPKFQNEIFLYEISQMEEEDEELASQYRQDVQQFLGLNEPMSPITEKLNVWEETAFQEDEIDICDEIHAAVRADLMDIATRSSTWLRSYFLPLPDVHVSSPQRFNMLLEAWMIDPCTERRANRQSPVSRRRNSKQ